MSHKTNLAKEHINQILEIAGLKNVHIGGKQQKYYK